MPAGIGRKYDFMLVTDFVARCYADPPHMPTQILKRTLLITTLAAISALATLSFICYLMGVPPIAAPFYVLKTITEHIPSPKN